MTNQPQLQTPNAVYEFLEGELGKEADARVKSKYGECSAISNVQGYDKKSGQVKGSTPFYVVGVNQALREFGIRDLQTATQADLAKASKLGVLNLRGTYVDTGLVLRTEEDTDYKTNTFVARYLAEQLRERGAEFSPENPLVVPLTGLQLEKSDNNYGLAFKLANDAEFYNAPILAQDGQFSSEDIDEQTGLPVKAEGGNRTIYTRNSGLSGLCLDGDLDVGSDDRVLGSSNSYGRVVLVRRSHDAPQTSLEQKVFTEEDLQTARFADREARRIYAISSAIDAGQENPDEKSTAVVRYDPSNSLTSYRQLEDIASEVDISSIAVQTAALQVLNERNSQNGNGTGMNLEKRVGKPFSSLRVRSGAICSRAVRDTAVLAGILGAGGLLMAVDSGEVVMTDYGMTIAGSAILGISGAVAYGYHRTADYLNKIGSNLKTQFLQEPAEELKGGIFRRAINTYQSWRERKNFQVGDEVEFNERGQRKYVNFLRLRNLPEGTSGKITHLEESDFKYTSVEFPLIGSYPLTTKCLRKIKAKRKISSTHSTELK